MEEKAFGGDAVRWPESDRESWCRKAVQTKIIAWPKNRRPRPGLTSEGDMGLMSKKYSLSIDLFYTSGSDVRFIVCLVWFPT